MGKTVLIVDDSESIRELLCFSLEQAGFSVFQGINGKDALKYLDGRLIDLVVTDLHMPRMDGIGLIKEIRKIADYRHIPIIFLTTESQASKKEEARSAGATGWIVKPFVSDKLLSVIRKVIR